MNGTSLPIEIDASNKVDEYTFSTNFGSKGSYYELILHNITDNNNIVTNKYANLNRPNQTSSIIWFVLFLIFAIGLVTCFLW